MTQQAVINDNSNLKFKDESVKLVQVIADQVKSQTQSVKTIIIEKEGKRYISLQKWWRKTAADPWEESKGFHFSLQETLETVSGLQTALSGLNLDK